MAIEKILVVDDDPLSRDLLHEILGDLGYEVRCEGDAMQVLDLLGSQDFDLLLTDLKMPGLSGIPFMEKVKARHPWIPVIIVTAFGSIEKAVEAMKRGADDFIVKPLSQEQLEVALSRIEERRKIQRENEYLKEMLHREGQKSELVGKSPEIRRVIADALKVAPSRASVLILGESGTGKELLARFVHTNSPRSEGPFIKVNCAALAPSLLESELFGHERGAFTGAIRKREGRFELADRGTLHLDEISEISPNLQAKLLRVLEEGEFERVGGNKTLRVDVRIIAATNRNLQQEMALGNFREDLYYRLNVYPLQIPPLRERRGDIAILAGHFLKRFQEENRRKASRLSSGALKLLVKHSWPGNVRELENVIQRAVIQCTDGELLPEHFSFESPSREERKPVDLARAVGMSMSEMEREMILKTLEKTNFNRVKAAGILGLSTRTLSNKIRIYRREAEGSDGAYLPAALRGKLSPV